MSISTSLLKNNDISRSTVDPIFDRFCDFVGNLVSNGKTLRGQVSKRRKRLEKEEKEANNSKKVWTLYCGGGKDGRSRKSLYTVDSLLLLMSSSVFRQGLYSVF